MFFVPDKSKLNGFKSVHVARGCDLFARFGKLESVPSTSDGQVIPMNMNKLDSLEYLDKYDAHQAELERQKYTVNDSSVNQHSQNDDSSGEA